jgi:hypothetical protein
MAIVSGNELIRPLVRIMREGCPGDRVPKMATQSAQFEPVAWWWTRSKVGQDLRELYEVPKELPPKLLVLVGKLDAAESNRSRLRGLIRRLDAIEGNYMSRYAPPAEPRSGGPSDDWSVCT